MFQCKEASWQCENCFHTLIIMQLKNLCFHLAENLAKYFHPYFHLFTLIGVRLRHIQLHSAKLVWTHQKLGLDPIIFEKGAIGSLRPRTNLTISLQFFLWVWNKILLLCKCAFSLKMHTFLSHSPNLPQFASPCHPYSARFHMYAKFALHVETCTYLYSH